MTAAPRRAPAGSRRTLCRLALAALVAVAAGGATGQSRAPARVGMLFFFAAPSASHPDPTDAVVRETLRELAHVEGESIVFERRFAGGSSERLAAMAAELVRLKVDVILAIGQPSRNAARQATATIPIVTLSGSDPVGEGWAKSLARPGGNVTGITFTYPELGPKRVELMKEALPAIQRVAMVVDPDEVVDFDDALRATEAGMQRLGVRIQVVRIGGADGLAAAFEAARRGGVQAVLPIAMWPHRARVAALALAAALPTIGESSEEAQAGYLLAYGADLNDLVRRALHQMDKILKGARPAEMPIERPTKFRLSVNLKTAKALGIALPRSLLLRADEVIE